MFSFIFPLIVISLVYIDTLFISLGFSVFGIYLAKAMIIGYQIESMIIRKIITPAIKSPNTLNIAINQWCNWCITLMVAYFVIGLLGFFINSFYIALAILILINYILIEITVLNLTTGKSNEGNR